MVATMLAKLGAGYIVLGAFLGLTALAVAIGLFNQRRYKKAMARATAELGAKEIIDLGVNHGGLPDLADGEVPVACAVTASDLVIIHGTRGTELRRIPIASVSAGRIETRTETRKVEDQEREIAVAELTLDISAGPPLVVAFFNEEVEVQNETDHESEAADAAGKLNKYLAGRIQVPVRA